MKEMTSDFVFQHCTSFKYFEIGGVQEQNYKICLLINSENSCLYWRYAGSCPLVCEGKNVVWNPTTLLDNYVLCL